MADDLIGEQIAYYRARAVDYEADTYRTPQAQALIAQVMDRVPAGGRLLELACGTGVWTQRLLTRAGSVTALDASSEMLEIARNRAPGASFVRADVFDWRPTGRYDVVFFGFWLSHVPLDRFGPFWDTVAAALADRGRVLFVDEHVGNAGHETWLGEHVAQRRLRDGSVHRIVKRYLDPAALTAQLSELGWRGQVRDLGGGWVLGEVSLRN